jgi:5'-methylthioinosine phosphorylase
MARIAIIGGTGLNRLAEATEVAGGIDTPYGRASAPVTAGRIGAHEILFLARHGQPHIVAPHDVNYRANIWLLRELGAEAIVTGNAVGGIAPELEPGDLVLPHQLIDYTWGRHSSFSDAEQLLHIDFTEPYTPALRNRLCTAVDRLDLDCGAASAGVYACTQGPRLETAAEIDRLERDGCTIVGMTAMPEAVLARELELPYAAVCLVVNKAAGRGEGPITEAEIGAVMATGVERMRRVFLEFIVAY